MIVSSRTTQETESICSRAKSWSRRHDSVGARADGTLRTLNIVPRRDDRCREGSFRISRHGSGPGQTGPPAPAPLLRAFDRVEAAIADLRPLRARRRLTLGSLTHQPRSRPAKTSLTSNNFCGTSFLVGWLPNERRQHETTPAVITLIRRGEEDSTRTCNAGALSGTNAAAAATAPAGFMQDPPIEWFAEGFSQLPQRRRSGR